MEDKNEKEPRSEKQEEEKTKTQQRSMKWPLVICFLYLNFIGLYGFGLLFTHAYMFTILFTLLLISLAVLGTTVGCHRLWAHRTFKAENSLKIFLMLCNTITGQCSIYDWVLDHRLHHKYHGTVNDPYNYKKGFFHCHILSHCIDRKDLKELEKEIDMSDIEEDKVVMFQKKYYWLLWLMISILIPFWAPMRFWREQLHVTFLVVIVFRIAACIQAAWLINSASILWGLDPLDRKSADTTLVFFFSKSLWPQYHYLLPWDYLSGEYGTYDSGCSTAFIKIMAVLGLASELTTITCEGVRSALAKAANEDEPVLDCLREKATITKLPQILM